MGGDGGSAPGKQVFQARSAKVWHPAGRNNVGMPPAPATAPATAPASATPALRLAARAWALLLVDTDRAIRHADRALALALHTADALAEARARTVRGFHLQCFGTLAEAADELQRACVGFDALGDRAGSILATVGLARTLLRGGQYRAAVDLLLPLRDEGLRVLRHHERAALLNAIAGCYSALGQSEQAIAYMHEALRDAGPRRGNGFDAVLHCNLANELTQLGDCEQALRHTGQGLSRCEGTRNSFLRSALLINRIIILTDLGRAAEALPDIEQVLAVPTDASGRGANALHFEALAIAALSAGETVLGERLVRLAEATPSLGVLDEQVERAVAQALLLRSQGRQTDALARLAAVRKLAGDDQIEGLSLRIRCQFFQQSQRLLAANGQTAQALADLQTWQTLHQRQDLQAHRAHYQSAALQTELLRLTHRLQDSQAKRRATERSRVKLAAINEQLAHKMAEVQVLQEALRQQATIDVLTGLHNRRHLNEVLPAQVAIARRAGTPLAVAILDLDHFKAVNDQHGHPAGDALLAAFGQLLQGSLRKSDLACRYGGEEFCLLLPRSTAAAARRKVQALLRRWRELQFSWGDAPAVQVLQGHSFSAGVTDSSDPLASPEALLNAADQALLAAKQAGRNRVLLASVHSAAHSVASNANDNASTVSDRNPADSGLSPRSPALRRVA